MLGLLLQDVGLRGSVWFKGALGFREQDLETQGSRLTVLRVHRV